MADSKLKICHRFGDSRKFCFVSVVLFTAFLLVIDHPIVNAQIPANMTISMNLSAQCASKSSFKVGDVCQVQIKITVPAQTTSLVVNIMASPNRTSLMAQLCQPTFTVGSNFGAVTPSLIMTSKQATSQVGTFFSAYVWLV